MSGRIEGIETYLVGRNGAGDEWDNEMRRILSTPGEADRVKKLVHEALRLGGEKGIPGRDRDGTEVMLVARVGGDRKKRVFLIKPDGHEYQLESSLWAEVMNRMWERDV